MKILLLGEYSNVHNSLAQGLRQLGHSVTLANDGDHWKCFGNDIDLSRKKTEDRGLTGRIRMFIYKCSFLLRMVTALLQMKNYDIVQLINPVFLPLKSEHLMRVYKYIRRRNKRIVLCAMGDDYYYCYVHRHLKPMRYSDYNIGKEEHMTDFARWTYNDRMKTAKQKLCRMIAADCDAIVSGMYEYWLPYHLTEDKGKDGFFLREKLHNIPFPVVETKGIDKESFTLHSPINIFVGISKKRSEFKGTDILLKAARDLEKKYTGKITLSVCEGLPYEEYCRKLEDADIILDQIYSYGPGMNALQAMSCGIVAVSGGEPEYYDLMGENEYKPIVNVTPQYDDVYKKLEYLIQHPKELVRLKREGIIYMKRNHDSVEIAKKYITIYNTL